MLSKQSSFFKKLYRKRKIREDVVLQQRCLVQLVAIAKEKKDIHGQVRWLKKITTSQKNTTADKLLDSAWIYRLVFLKDGDFPTSKNVGKKAFDRSQEEWDKEVMAESQLLMGMSFYRENRPEDARVLVSKSQYRIRRDQT